MRSASSQTQRASARGAPSDAQRQAAGTPVVLAFAGAAALALLISFLATPHGLGASPDSTQYLSAASNFLAGRGLLVHWWLKGNVPLTHFPPLFPATLGAIGASGLPLTTSARVLNSVSLLVTLLIVFRLTREVTGSLLAAFLGTLVVAVAPDVQELHAMIWSEPLFLTLSMIVLLLVDRSMRSERWGMLVVAGLLAGCATITRYVGIALIASCALSFVLLVRGALMERLRRAIIFLLVSALPIIVLFARNERVAGNAANRELAFHPLHLQQVRSGASTVYHWLVPRSVAPLWELPLMLALGAASLLFALVWVRTRREGAAPPPPSSRTVPHDIEWLLLVYVLSYVVLVCFTISVADAQTEFGPRMMAPLIPPVTMLATSFLYDASRHPVRRRATLVLLGVVGISLLSSIIDWVRDARRDGLGYNSNAWRLSPLVAATRALPAGTEIYSNYPDAIYYLTGREVTGIPRLASPTSLKPNPQYPRQMRVTCTSAGVHRTVIAYFIRIDPEWFIPSIAEVRSRLSSRPERVFTDGVLDTVPASCAARTSSK